MSDMNSTSDKILNTLMLLTQIANNSRLSYERKLHQILSLIVSCMNTKKGSIMLMKGRKYLEVIASTNPELVGIKQPISNESPSSWVVKHKQPLYVDTQSASPDIRNHFAHYKKDAFFLVPIINKNKAIGVISLTEKINFDRFSTKEQEILFSLSGHIIGTLENIRLAESLRKNRLILHRKNQKLKQLEKIRTDLFNMLIHDLKGPLSEIIANVDILSYTVDPDNMEFVNASQTACDTLYRMIANLLDVTRLEEGSLKLIYEKCSPDDLVKEALARLHGIARIRELNLEEQFPEIQQNMAFYGDRNILLRVLQNLLTNAIHYSSQGQAIQAGFQYLDDHNIVFFIQDNGPGIPVEFQQVIFDKFTQVQKKNDGRLYTTGLGLTFCKLAVEAHKGRIFVESDGLRGSCFKFILPLMNKGNDYEHQHASGH